MARAKNDDECFYIGQFQEGVLRMNNEKMGQFISELRKSRQMTQKELAEKLNISDKAVSKWERGLSCPDISLLSPLSGILGVTITELLNGERTGTEDINNVEVNIANALAYGEKTAKRKIALTQSVWVMIFAIFLLIGVSVVSIVDVAISGRFTWSLIPISASVFAWFVFFPTIKFGMKGIVGSLFAFSLFIVPFLYVLDHVINRIIAYHAPIFAMGVRIAPLSIVYIWIEFFLSRKLKTRKLIAAAISVLLASPLTFFINYMIDKMLNQPWFSVSMILNISAPIVASMILFIIAFSIRKRT